LLHCRMAERILESLLLNVLSPGHVFWLICENQESLASCETMVGLTFVG
jgi:hypothetical protein